MAGRPSRACHLFCDFASLKEPLTAESVLTCPARSLDGRHISAKPVGGHHSKALPASREGFSISKTHVAVLIDGGYLRVQSRHAGLHYSNDLIEKVAHSCVQSDETLLRVLYYDCAPYQGTLVKPISGEEVIYESKDGWMRELASRDYFAVRRGELKFRGFKPVRVPVLHKELTDSDFKPDFEQKGVDMRIGLDMATFSATRSVARLILVSGDTDCVPAMKHARKAGLQMAIIALPNQKVHGELSSHADFIRPIPWPVDAEKAAARRPRDASAAAK